MGNIKDRVSELSSLPVILRNRANLVVIHTDEHNFRTLGCYRDTLPEEQALIWGKDNYVETPNIDWLARIGALCVKFYAASPICTPSRASFVSGMFPTAKGVQASRNHLHLKHGLPTFASVLSENGYKTGYIGKWHIGGDARPGWAPEESFGFDDSTYMFNRGHWKKLGEKDGQPFTMDCTLDGKPAWSAEGADEKSFTTDFLSDRAIDFIVKNRAEPFCVMLSIPDPHGPDDVREPYASMYKNMKFEKPATCNVDPTAAPIWAKPDKKCATEYDQSLYFGMVKCIDDNVGKILRALHENNLMDSTVIVFTADHGDLRNEHQRQNKFTPHEASAKAPLIIYNKKRIKPGKIIDLTIGTQDFMPTILGLLGCDYPVSVDGRDLAGLLDGSKESSEFKDITFARMEATGEAGEDYPAWVGVISSRYKLILSENERPWLFDLKEEPDEMNNLIEKSKYKRIAAALAEELLKYGERCNDKIVKATKIQNQIQALVKLVNNMENTPCL